MSTSKLSSRYRTFSPTFLHGSLTRISIPSLLGSNMKNRREILIRCCVIVLSIALLASLCSVIVLNTMIEISLWEGHQFSSSCNITNNSLASLLYNDALQISITVFSGIHVTLVLLSVVYEVAVIVMKACIFTIKCLNAMDICVNVFLMSAFIGGSIGSFLLGLWSWAILADDSTNGTVDESRITGLTASVFTTFGLFIVVYNCYFIICIVTVSKASKDHFKKQLLEEQLQNFINS